MQAVGALVTSIGASGIGAGLTTALSVAGTVVSVMSANAAARAEEDAAIRAAQVEEENAQQARIAGRSNAQDLDMEAAELLASLEARQGASGLLLSSPSFARRRDRNRVVADTNRERVIEDAEREASSADNRAQSQRISARNARRQRFFNTIAGGVQLGDDLISGANLAARRRASATDRNRIAV